MSRKPVALAFFQRPAARVARELIGLDLVRAVDGVTRRYAVTETEAYEGVHDVASHSSKGRTVRTEVMFRNGGVFYIYRIYGMHWMLNVVTGGAGEGQAVLVRGVEGISGPGRVASALSIGPALNGQPARRTSGLWFETPAIPRRCRTQRTARIGVGYAGPIWSTKELRFVSVQRVLTRR